MTEIFRKGDGDEKIGMMVAVVTASCKHAEGNTCHLPSWSVQGAQQPPASYSQG